MTAAEREAWDGIRLYLNPKAKRDHGDIRYYRQCVKKLKQELSDERMKRLIDYIVKGRDKHKKGAKGSWK